VDERRELLAVLQSAQDLGLIGPGALDAHLEHSRAWTEVVGPSPDSLLDLGSGGGVPGLPLALFWPEVREVLLDAHRRSTAFIDRAVERLGWTDRVRTITERAEVAGRDPGLRESFPLVLARGFGAPAVTAECGSPFVEVGGRFSVSEPPGGDPARWPEDRLADLGLVVVEIRVVGTASFVVLEKIAALAEAWPRRVGKPHSHPLW
jgi:16S rRNA (guanine527-N7)-methyltransferase